VYCNDLLPFFQYGIEQPGRLFAEHIKKDTPAEAGMSFQVHPEDET
jgi:hypothetical protein